MLIDVLIATANRGGVENVIKMMIEDLEGPDMHFRVVQLVWEGDAWLSENVSYYPLLKGKGDYTLDIFIDSYSSFLEQHGIPDLILAAVWPYTVYVARRALDAVLAGYCKTKVISWMHHGMEEYKRAYDQIEEWLGYADGHFAINMSNQKILEELFPNVSTYRVRNPIEMPPVPVRAEKNEKNKDYVLKLVFVGRISEEKNLELIFSALSQTENCSITIIGSCEKPEYEKRLKEQANNLGLTDRIEWLGWQQDPWKFAQNADALCMSSVYEGFPLVALEALAHGIPVISSKAGGIDEIINDGINGYIYNNNDAKMLADILNRIVHEGGLHMDAKVCYRSIHPYERHSALQDMKHRLIAFMKEEKTIDPHHENYKISVIIPTYNREKLIRRAIESVLAQKGQGHGYEIIEVIVVDDCSSDNTEEIVRDIDDPRILYHRLPQNCGAAAARNIGVEMSGGDWIAFQDSDDIWHDDKLLKQAEYIYKHQDVCMVSHPIKAFFSDGSVFCTEVLGEGDPVVYLAERNYIDTPTMLVKKEVFQRLNGFDTGLKALEDWDFALRFADKYLMGMVPEALLDSDMIIEGMSADSSKYYESRCGIIAGNREILNAHGCFDAAMKSLFMHAQKNGILDKVGRMLELFLTKTL